MSQSKPNNKQIIKCVIFNKESVIIALQRVLHLSAHGSDSSTSVVPCFCLVLITVHVNPNCFFVWLWSLIMLSLLCLILFFPSFPLFLSFPGSDLNLFLIHDPYLIAACLCINSCLDNNTWTALDKINISHKIASYLFTSNTRYRNNHWYRNSAWCWAASHYPSLIIFL